MQTFLLYTVYALVTIFDAICAGETEGFCNLKVKDVKMTRSATNQGFHRDLMTNIEVSLEENVECSTCWLLLVEVIPSGMFVDLHEIKSAQSFGGPKVLSTEDIDVEKPEYLSSEHTILVYVPSPLQVTNTKQHAIQVELPVHLRYHRPSNDPDITSALVRLQHPNVMIRCQGSTSGNHLETVDLYQAPCDSRNDSMCAWQDLQYYMDNGKPLQFHVPVGQQQHTALISIVTIAATIAGVIVLLRIMFSPQKNKIR